MKLLVLTLCAFSLFAADSKVAAPAPQAAAKSTTPQERPLTNDELIRSEYDQKSIMLLGEQHKVEEHQKELNAFNQEAQPFQSDHFAVVAAACKSVGVAEKDIQSQCGFTNGLDQNGKPMLDQNGKPVVPRVWKIEPAPKPVSVPGQEKK